MKRVLAVGILLCFILNSKSQSLHYAGVFPTIDHSAEITNKLGYGIYYFGAYPLLNISKPKPGKDQSFLLFYSEQSLSYNVSKSISLTGSYVYQRENVVYNNYVNENRFYLQGKYKHSIKQLTFSHRFRFDGRFIQNQITNTTPFTHRVRYLLGAETPLSQTLYFTAYEEVFFNTSGSSGFTYAENWAYAALGKTLNKKNKIEAGILYISWNIGPQSWFNQYYLQLTWVNHLDFRKTTDK